MNFRRSIKVAGSLAIVFAVAAVGAQAKAPGWTTKIAGVEATMAAGAERPATITSTGAVTLGFSGLFLKSTTTGDCHAAARIIGTAAGVSGTLTAISALECKNVEVTGAAGCTVNSIGQPAGTLLTAPLTGTLVWLQQTQTNDESGITFSSEAATNGSLTTMDFSGATCPLLGQKLALTGSTICKVSKGPTIHTSTLEFECKDNPPIEIYWSNVTPTRVKVEGQDKLKVGATAATFAGVFHITPGELGVQVGIEPH
jgi:hypothetical protein